MHNHPIILNERAAALAQYPHARVVGPFVFVSGISCRRHDNSHEGVTIHPDGRVEKDIRSQTQAVLDNIAIILRAAGGDLQDVVDCTVFLTDMKDYGGMNEVWNRTFAKDTAPARTTVGVRELPHPNLLVEMKVVAVARSQA